jgi:hypothetical protein
MKQRQRFSDEDNGSAPGDTGASGELAARRSEAEGSVKNISELIDRVLSTNSEIFLEATRQRGGE